MPVKDDRSVGWTKRSAAVTVLLAMEEHRKRAGLRLVQLREAKGWNQEDLAHESGLSVKTISRFENGRHDGRRSTLRSLASALDVDEAVIVGDPPDPLGLAGPNGGDGDQLDRIEAKLDELLDLLRPTGEPESPAEVLEEAVLRARERQQQIAAASTDKSRRASGA